jgi:predicted RNase H-like HicB family nuclease
MLKDRYSYVAVFTYDDDGICIDFPDLPGCCPCADAGDTDSAIKNAKEALGLHIWGMEQDGEELPQCHLVKDDNNATNKYARCIFMCPAIFFVFFQKMT